MGKIKLVATGWSMIPEGKTVLKVTEVEYKEDFGKLEIKMTSQEGDNHNERYSLITNKGEMNEGAYRAFSYFAKMALNNTSVDEIDPQDLVGCYIEATIEHVESTTISEKTGEPFVNVRLNDIKSVVGFAKVQDTASVTDNDVDVDEDVSSDELDDFLD